MTIYCVEFGGRIGLVDAKSVDQALRQVAKEEGLSNGPFKGRRATARDIAWIEGMGGRIPAAAKKEKAR